jgi:uncharacterized YigZ family protein
VKESVTVKGVSIGEYEEKKSKFIAVLCPVSTEEEASAVIDEIKKKNVGARHNVYAFRLSSGTERSSDDGEPSGTGGKPLLEILKAGNLSDVLVVVTRYFGGVLLGTGGLKRAYTAAANEALKLSVKLHKRLAVRMSFTVDYSYFDRLNFLIEKSQGEITEKNFTNEVSLTVVMPATEYENFSKEFEKNLVSGVKCTEREEILYFFQK